MKSLGLELERSELRTQKIKPTNWVRIYNFLFSSSTIVVVLLITACLYSSHNFFSFFFFLLGYPTYFDLVKCERVRTR